jgi:hypothetical protein
MPQAKPLSATASLQIFKPGRHTAMSGQALMFSEADLLATVGAYDPAKHEAPLVVGHPSHDLPAYGWVQSLQFSEGGIDATPAQVNTDFADMVAAGAFKKISASFYSPDAPQNPVPGVFYLRHVGFLGAQPPAVKGLRNPSFADGEQGVLTFSEWDDVDNASLWRNLREWFIAKFGQAEADTVIPSSTVKNLEQGAQDEVREAATEAAAASTDPAFSETQPKENRVTPEQKAALEAENERLRTELASNRAAQTHAANVAFCEGLAGVMPAWRALAVATLDHFAAQPAVVEFGEGDAKAPLTDQLKAFLQSLPAVVQFSETATSQSAAGGTDADTVSFAAPQGYTVDEATLAIHNKAQAHQKAKGGTYADAVKAVA